MPRGASINKDNYPLLGANAVLSMDSEELFVLLLLSEDLQYSDCRSSDGII